MSLANRLAGIKAPGRLAKATNQSRENVKSAHQLYLSSPLISFRSVSTKKLIDRYKNSKAPAPIPEHVSIAGSQDLKKQVFGQKNVDYTLASGGGDVKEETYFKKAQFSQTVALFTGNFHIQNLAESLNIRADTYEDHLQAFCRDLVLGKVEGATYLDCLPINDQFGSFGLHRHFLSKYLDYLIPYMNEKERSCIEQFRSLTNLTAPGSVFPKTRRIQRKIIMHVGPTNSGKTYQALKKLSKSNKGIYCGPLRLLAYEVWRKFVAQGLPCDLLTGEERVLAKDYFNDPKKYRILESSIESSKEKPLKRKDNPFFHSQKLISATTEMVSVNELYDVAVIDEIQLINDVDRGAAWTRALLGVQAHEVHLCGEASAVPIVREICRELDEEVEVHEYQRLSPLKSIGESLRGYYKNIQEGDCIVSFTRDDIFRIKGSVERVTGLKCALIYGRLPAEIRAQQARLFNDPNSPYKVLVATDAVGMGLNLNIRRVIFETLEKFDGRKATLMPPPQVKQIAGRAGRFNSAYNVGMVVSFNNDCIGYLRSCLEKPIKYHKKIGIQPESEAVLRLAYMFPKDTMAQIWTKYSILAKLDPRYFFCCNLEQMRLSSLFSGLPLTIEDRQVFMTAPVDMRNPAIANFTRMLAESHAHSRIIPLAELIPVPAISFQFVGPEFLESYEIAHKCVMLYFWLSYRLPHTFSDVEEAQRLKALIEKRIEFMLPRVRVELEDNSLNRYQVNY